ncbi:MAG: hypothetical protein GX568_07965 [Candidatus Gastranaerophilales bacterium]|nr:hypothetical protein [Candidatus Gastranaerophilales bacterium]
MLTGINNNYRQQIYFKNNPPLSNNDEDDDFQHEVPLDDRMPDRMPDKIPNSMKGIISPENSLELYRLTEAAKRCLNRVNREVIETEEEILAQWVLEDMEMRADLDLQI